MAFIKGNYTTNHPKDVAARRMQALKKTIKEQGCTKRELEHASEPNVRKCMKEMQATSKSGEQYKADGKFLGEDTNLDKHRRR